MTPITQLRRELLIAANNWQSKTSGLPKVRNIYMSRDYYVYCCFQNGGVFGTFEGFAVYVVVGENHPDYTILLK